MPTLNLSQSDWQLAALEATGPTCLVIRAWLEPVAGMDRFQPSGFPEIGHVIYDAPRKNGAVEKVCIVDSPASMANHLETVCLDGPTGGLDPDLAGLPYVRCVTDKDDAPSKDDPRDTQVCTTLTEGHRLASDYFLDGFADMKWMAEAKKKTKDKNGKEKEETIPAHWSGTRFRDRLREEFGIEEVKKDKTYFVWPETWWKIYKTIFKHDPNSLIHGVMFAKEQIKISRLLTAHMEAFGAARVGRSGVKFDRLGKTTSGQPIFAVEDQAAHAIVATFILDIALLRSYGRGDKGLSSDQKRLLLDLAVWKVKRLLEKPFRFRSGCHLACSRMAWSVETDAATNSDKDIQKPETLKVDIATSINKCGFRAETKPHDMYYPRADLFKPPKDDDATATAPQDHDQPLDSNADAEEGN